MPTDEILHSIPIPLDSNANGNVSGAEFVHCVAKLYKSVVNAAEILEAAAAFNSYFDNPSTNASEDGDSQRDRITFDRAVLVLKPEMLVSPRHLTLALNRTIVNVVSGKCYTSNLASEVVYAMASSTCVTRTFEDMTHEIKTLPQGEAVNVLMVYLFKGGALRVNANSVMDEYFGKLKAPIPPLPKLQGQPIDMQELEQLTDKARITESFNVAPAELELPGGLATAIYNRIATKRV